MLPCRKTNSMICSVTVSMETPIRKFPSMSRDMVISVPSAFLAPVGICRPGAVSASPHVVPAQSITALPRFSGQGLGLKFMTTSTFSSDASSQPPAPRNAAVSTWARSPTNLSKYGTVSGKVPSMMATPRSKPSIAKPSKSPSSVQFGSSKSGVPKPTNASTSYAPINIVATSQPLMVEKSGPSVTPPIASNSSARSCRPTSSKAEPISAGMPVSILTRRCGPCSKKKLPCK